jgi:hypothetical protein
LLSANQNVSLINATADINIFLEVTGSPLVDGVILSFVLSILIKEERWDFVSAR